MESGGNILLNKEVRGKQTEGMHNSASQHVQGLSNFIKQIDTSKRSNQHVNKSLSYLKKQ